MKSKWKWYERTVQNPRWWVTLVPTLLIAAVVYPLGFLQLVFQFLDKVIEIAIDTPFTPLAKMYNWQAKGRAPKP